MFTYATNICVVITRNGGSFMFVLYQMIFEALFEKVGANWNMIILVPCDTCFLFYHFMWLDMIHGYDEWWCANHHVNWYIHHLQFGFSSHRESCVIHSHWIVTYTYFSLSFNYSSCQNLMKPAVECTTAKQTNKIKQSASLCLKYAAMYEMETHHEPS